MTTVDELWFKADEARQQAEQTVHRLREQYDPAHTFETTKHVSRRRFRTVADRIRDNGAPYGAHAVTYRESGELVLVRHEGVDCWVLPGGEAGPDESFRTAAQRELAEEAGISAEFGDLGLLGRIRFRNGDHTTWGVLPVFEARAIETELSVCDPDDEISDARWFEELPPDTRDRDELLAWRTTRFD